MFVETSSIVTGLFVAFTFHYNFVGNKINFLFQTFCVQYTCMSNAKSMEHSASNYSKLFYAKHVKAIYYRAINRI